MVSQFCVKPKLFRNRILMIFYPAIDLNSPKMKRDCPLEQVHLQMRKDAYFYTLFQYLYSS